MTFYLIGTGRVAHFIASRISGKGHRCLGVFGRNQAVAAKLAAQLAAPVVSSLDEITGPADAVLLAVSDSAIESLAQEIPKQQGTVVHFSGTVALHALLPHPNRAVCWPVYSISGINFPENNLPAVGEGSTLKAQETVAKLAEALSLSLTHVPENARAQLHLAAVVGNNFVNHLLCLCEKICSEAHLPPDVLRPLLTQTFERAFWGNPCETQTGPARRGDVATQKKHLELLQAHPQWQAVYKAISESIAAQYRPQ